MLTNRTITIGKTYPGNFGRMKLKWHNEDSFYVPACAIDKKTGKPKVNGYVRISIKIVPQTDADISKLGHGRDNPNHDPFCPPPVGRIQFTMNPIKMLLQLVGPAVRRKIYLGCCLILCAALCIYMFPVIMANAITKVIL